MDNIQALTYTAGIMSNKAFLRLAEKTQVVFPQNGRIETVQNRLTHSFEVGNSARMAALSLDLPGIKVDYQHALYNTCLLHDPGHPSFGHEGTSLLDRRFKALGLEEGFCDNNNNFVVIEKNQIEVCDYTVASIIKYPENLYPSQKDELIRKLDIAIAQDIRQFEKTLKIFERPTRTIACEVMDEVDRNSYVTSDLADCFSLKLGNSNSLSELLESNQFTDNKIIEFLIIAINAIDRHDKTLIKKVFNDLKVRLNLNYYLGDNIQLIAENTELIELREFLFKIEKELFIDSESVVKQRVEHMAYLNNYIDWVLEGNYPSSTYKRLIENSSSEVERLRAIRDMIGETTDWYVINHNVNK